MTSVEKLSNVLKDQLNLHTDPKTFKRLRPGRWQRGGGAFSWVMNRITETGGKCGGAVVGSSWSVKELLQAPKLEEIYQHGDIELFPGK